MSLQNARPDTKPTDAEDGYLLLTVLVMVFLLLLALSVAAPRVAKEIQRDKEREAVERGLQYRRAIQLYYKKFGAYPTDIKQLEKTNEIRFLRKRYTDPITGKDDWRLIHMGEAKVPPLGFFGQPLQAGMSSISTGPGLSSGIYAPSDTDGSGGANGSSAGSTNGSTNGSAPASGGSSGFGFSNSNSGNGSNGGLGSSGSGFGSSGSGFGSSNNGFGSSNNGGVGGTPTGTNGPGGNGPGGNGFGGNASNGGSTFGSAAPIVGIGIPVKKDSILEYHKQKKYSSWEFVYDPQTDMIMAGGVTSNGNVNSPGSSTNSGGTGTGTNNPSGQGGSGSFGFNNGNSGGGSGGGSGFGNFGGSGSGSSGNPAPTMPAPTMPNNPQQ